MTLEDKKERKRETKKKELDDLETGPFNLVRMNIIEDFFNSNRSYIEALRQQIVIHDKPYPYICLKLKDIMKFNEKLYNYIKKNPENAIEDICEKLLDKARFDRDVNEFLKKKDTCKFEAINLSFDLEEIEDSMPLYDNFSLGTKPYIEKLIRIRARFLDLKIFRENIATLITYTCSVCGTDFDILQFRGRKGKYRVPKFCINMRCKAKGYNDFRVKEIKEYHEMGTFRIGEIDFSKQNEKECYTFLDFDYFSGKTQEINLNDIIEIIGIIKLDPSEIGTRKEEQKVHEFIKVIDFNPIELKIIDPAIIKELYEQFKNDRNYHHQIMDSIHPLTRGIHAYRIFKIINLLGIISSDSWDTLIKNRCSINFIVGSKPALFKGSITSEFRNILGANNVGRISGQDSTPMAFLPTSQRSKEKDFQIRYGAFAYYNKKFLVVDESAKMLGDKALRSPIKNLEDGYISKGSDGTVLHAECKLSVGWLMNYQNKEQDGDAGEGYDYNFPLRENLGKIEESTLQRIDLHYTIPNLPTQIEEILEKRLFNKDEGNIDEKMIYNYINEVKRIYPIQKISIPMEKKLREYIKLLRAKRDIKRGNVREFRTLIKLVCGISAMRLKREIDESDLEYLQKYLVNLMIPFFEYNEIRRLKLNHLDMNEIFQDTFNLLTEIHESIPIREHISIIRQFLEAHYFPDSNGNNNPYYSNGQKAFMDRVFIKNSSNNGIDDYMPEKLNLENAKYRSLYESEKIKEFIEKVGYIITKKGRATYYIKKSLFKEKLLKEIKQIGEEVESPIEIDWLMDELRLDYTCNEETFRQILNELFESEELIKLKNDILK